MIQTRKYNLGNTPRKIQIRKTIQRLENIRTHQSEKSGRKQQFEPIQIGKYKSTKQKQVGKYKSAEVSRENTSRRTQIEKIMGNTNRETHVGKQIRTYKSENTNREIKTGKY